MVRRRGWTKRNHRKNHQQTSTDQVKPAARNTDRQSMNISLARLAPPTLLPLTKSPTKNGICTKPIFARM